MRTRLARGVAVGALTMMSLAACSTGEPADTPTTVVALPSVSPSEPDGEVSVPDLTDESCQEILTAVAGAREALNAAVGDILSAPDAFAQVADNLRAAAADANADLSAAAGELADAFDDIASDIRSGQLLNLDIAPLQAPLSELFTLCNG